MKQKHRSIAKKCKYEMVYVARNLCSMILRKIDKLFNSLLYFRCRKKLEISLSEKGLRLYLSSWFIHYFSPQ